MKKEEVRIPSIEECLPKERLCNGCKNLNFRGKSCKKMKQGSLNLFGEKTQKNLILNTYTTSEGYINFIRPSTCNEKEEKK